MATYAIGDIQGCYEELSHLLEIIGFSKTEDRLWLCGDLVNRGPQSLAVLRWARDLGERAQTVLGNHDLHLLAVAAGQRQPRSKDTFQDVLAARDRDELLHWLRQRPLLLHEAELGFTLVHAGLPPQWDLDLARRCAVELETCLRGPENGEFFGHMYGNAPERWSYSLEGWERLRFITNCFTRMRYCDADGRLELRSSGPPGSQPAGYMPWFQVPSRASASQQIIFGHWSTLRLTAKDFHAHGVWPLDTGCVWGGWLTALRLEDRQIFAVPGKRYARIGE
jgi:bis(5'-nucleosyl)-tetraphosphatase (symmetrical)